MYYDESMSIKFASTRNCLRVLLGLTVSAYLKSALNARINKLENEKLLRGRGRINAVIKWNSEEELLFLIQQIREHEQSANARDSYLVVPKGHVD